MAESWKSWTNEKGGGFVLGLVDLVIEIEGILWLCQ